MLDAISLDVPWDLVEVFSTQPRWRPEDVAVAAGMICDRLSRLDIPHTVHRPDLYLSIPHHAEIRTDAGVLKAKPPAYSSDCPDGCEAALVYVPATLSTSITTLFQKNQNADDDLPEKVRGKIVVSEGFSFPGKVRDMEEMGAVGMIAVNPGADSHWGICTPIWGTPGLDDLSRKPGIPVAAVNNPDGQALIARAQAGGQATIVTRMDEGWFSSPVPEVRIEGTTEPENFVLLHGHYDSWDVGVGDNATGDATLLEAARVLHANRPLLRRSVRIVWWPGHSTGRYAGSTWYADTFAHELHDGCVAQVNCDSPGCRWATAYDDVCWTAETEAFAKATIHAITGQDSTGTRPHRAGDYAFNNIGISSCFMLSSMLPPEVRAEHGYYTVGGCGGNIAWHTEHDLIEIADRDNLLRDMRVYVGAVAEMAIAETLPFDWRATMDEFAETVHGYQTAAGDRFDLGPAMAEVAAVRDALDRLNASDVPLHRKNAVALRLARVLVPINFTTGPRFAHDPALPVPPLPTVALAADLANLDPDAMRFTQVQLVRGQNRLIAALREARHLVDTA